MSAVCVLTPIVISSWPAISTAILGVASTMGYTVVTTEKKQKKLFAPKQNSIELQMENSEVLEESFGSGEKMIIEKDGVQVEFSRTPKGTCSICVTGEKQSKAKLKEIGEEISGRVIQQFAYHKLMTELKDRGYAIVDESVSADQSIQVRVRSIE